MGSNSMEASIEKFARGQLVEGLHQCSKKQVRLFKQMYSFKNMEADIDTVVDNMPVDKLDWALQQVNRTLDRQIDKIKKEKKL